MKLKLIPQFGWGKPAEFEMEVDLGLAVEVKEIKKSKLFKDKVTLKVTQNGYILQDDVVVHQGDIVYLT